MLKESILIFLASAILLFCCSISLSVAAPLPDTMQMKCYDAAGAEMSCEGTGQDGAYNINLMSFTDNGNGIVTDNVTGLLWQKEDDNTKRTWTDAGTYCNSLTLGGQSGWRLPSYKELMGIAEYNNFNQQTFTASFFPDIKLNYWSSIALASDTSFAWFIETLSGGIFAGAKSENKFVRCVLATAMQATLSFKDNGNGTVTDNITGLMWQQGDYGAMSWADATSACKGLSLVGQSDWRLPNIKELASIRDDTKINLAIDTIYFPNTNENSYWSSTTDTFDRNCAGVVNYTEKVVSNSFSGIVVFGPKSSSNSYVRCVRGGQQNNCAATVSASLTVHVPIIAFSGANYWADLQYNSASSNLTIVNAGIVSDFSPYSSCTASTLSSDFKLHIPVVMLNGISYRLDLQLSGSAFVIAGFGVN